MTTSIQYSDAEMTRSEQMSAALALGHILKLPLPPASWIISRYNAPWLSASITASSDEKTLHHLAQWAVFLRAEIKAIDHTPGHVAVVVAGDYRGVRMDVSAIVAASARLPRPAMTNGAAA